MLVKFKQKKARIIAPSVNWTGTAVPNSGEVMEINFNNSLSVEEVVAILDTLDFGNDDTYVIISDKNNPANEYRIRKTNGTYGIFHAAAESTEDNSKYILFHNQETAVEHLGFFGWNPEGNMSDVMNVEANSAYGLQNDKLCSLVSTTPFTQAAGGAGTPVPGDGSAVDIYVNTSLSNEEVIAILDTLEFKTSNYYYVFRYMADNNHYSLYVHKNSDGIYNIVEMVPGNNNRILFGENCWDTAVLETAPNPIVYSHLSSEVMVLDNNQNDKLSSLFSITPFVYTEAESYPLSGEYDGSELVIVAGGSSTAGTPVPNSGYVEKVYFNTNLSDEEIIALFDTIAVEHSILLFTGEHENDFDGCHYIMTEGGAAISCDGVPVWVSPKAPDYIISSVGFTGWKTDFNGIVEINDNAFNKMDLNGDGNPYDVGVENDKLVNLFSATPNFGSGSGSGSEVSIDIKALIESGKLPLTIRVTLEK